MVLLGLYHHHNETQLFFASAHGCQNFPELILAPSLTPAVRTPHQGAHYPSRFDRSFLVTLSSPQASGDRQVATPGSVMTVLYIVPAHRRGGMKHRIKANYSIVRTVARHELGKAHVIYNADRDGDTKTIVP